MTNARTAKPVRAAYFAAIGAGIVCVGLIATVAWGALRPVEEISRQAEVMAADKDPEAAALAARAVTANPVDARAIKVLGVLADRAGKPQKALELMTLSDKVSRRDAYTQTWLMQHDLQTGNYAQALVRADALLRVYPEAGKILIPALTTIATDSRGAAAISGQLSTLPPWRSSFG